MAVSKDLRSRWKFFMEWAGYATPPGRAACALSLARAECWAEEEGVRAEWEQDECPDLSWCEDCAAAVQLRRSDYSERACWLRSHTEEHFAEQYGCTLTLGGETVSLWGIDRPCPEYRRVVEAELAQELETDFFAALAKHIRSL